MLLPGVPFCFIVNLICKLQASGAGVGATTLTLSINGVSYLGMMGWLLFSTLLYTCLAWYLDLVLPKQFGQRRSACFCCARQQGLF